GSRAAIARDLRARAAERSGEAHRRSRQLRARQQGVRERQPRLAVGAVEPEELSRDRQGAVRALARGRKRLARGPCPVLEIAVGESLCVNLSSSTSPISRPRLRNYG